MNGSTQTISATKLSDFIGVRIAVPDNLAITDPSVIAAIKEHVGKHHLVSIRGRRITPEEQVLLASGLGRPIPFVQSRYRHPEFEEVMISSNVVRDNRPIGVARVGNFWHQDSSYVSAPPPFTVLHGVRVPSTTGHTLFASAVDVFNRLPDHWKHRLRGKTARHTVTKRQRIQDLHVGLSIAEFKAIVAQEYPDVEHPVVMRDTDTADEFVYGAPEYLRSVNGFDANENQEYLSLLDSLIQDPDHVLCYEWADGDILIWKTPTTFHAATEVQPGVERIVHRVSVG
jgi:taurine dioxygenase